MVRGIARFGIVLALALASAASAFGQVTFDFNFNSGSGFGGSTANPGYYTQDRRDAILRAGNYAATQFDGRGTVNVALGTQTNLQIGSGTLAIGGTFYYIGHGYVQNGITFTQATNNDSGTTGHSNMDYNSDFTNWFTGTGSSAGSGQYDMHTVTLHELTHSFGFASLINKTTGLGLGAGAGGGGTFSQLDGNLRVGSGPNAIPILAGLQGFKVFNIAGGAQLSDLIGNNIYFHGEFTKATNGGNAVKMAGNGDLSHLDATSAPGAVMLPSIATGVDHRTYTNIDLAMLIDFGWNQFVWKNTTANFGDNTTSLAGTPWQNLDQDDVLSPVGSITTNSVLRFGGTGGYVATNNLTLANDRYSLTRLILNATSGTSSIAATGSNAFRFDSTISVAPQIRQDGAGAFLISHPLELTGRNLQLTGDGAGRVTLSGTIGQQSGQTGAITKSGTSVFVLSGSNTYSGGTSINGGALIVNNTAGSGTGSGDVIVNSGGTLAGTGTISGATTVNAGGTIRGDSDTGTGTLNLGTTTIKGSTGSTGAILATRLSTSGTAIAANSKLALGANTLNLDSTAGKFNIVLLNDGALLGNSAYTIVLAAGSAGSFYRNGTVWNTTTNAFTANDFNVLSGSGVFNYENSLLSVNGSNQLILQFTPVPEPGTLFALGFVGIGLAAGYRRWRRQ